MLGRSGQRFSFHSPNFLRSYVPRPETFRCIQTPALAIYTEAVRHNIASVLQLCGGNPLRWRPHVKTTKLPQVWQELFRAGVRRYKCATTRELQLLLDTLRKEAAETAAPPHAAETAGPEIIDVLLAYPVPRQGPVLDRVAQLNSARLGATDRIEVRISVLVEDASQAVTLPPGVGWFIDINPGGWFIARLHQG